MMQQKITIIILACFLLSCNKQETLKTEKVINVGVLEVEKKLSHSRLCHNGILSAETVKNHAFKIPGRIEHLHIKKGEQVKSGQLLVSIQSTEYKLAKDNAEQVLYQAKKAYNNAETFYRKLEDSQKSGGISQNDYEKAKLDMEIKKADYEQARINLNLQTRQWNDCFLKADIDGTILDIYPKPGELVDAGTPVLIFRNHSPVAEISVNARELSQIDIGDSARVCINKHWYTGNVYTKSEMPNLETLAYLVQISINNKDFNKDGLYVGMPLITHIYTGYSESVRIPVTAICADGEDFVYCVSGGRAVRKNITKGAIWNELVEVKGLIKGDSLIVNGIKNTYSGIKTIINN